jgi:hypothetical protein
LGSRYRERGIMDARDLQELRRKAADVSGGIVSFCLAADGEWWLRTSATRDRIVTLKELEDELCRLAKPKMPDEMTVTLPTRYLECIASCAPSSGADFLAVREIFTKALADKRKELGIEPPEKAPQ